MWQLYIGNISENIPVIELKVYDSGISFFDVRGCPVYIEYARHLQFNPVQLY